MSVRTRLASGLTRAAKAIGDPGELAVSDPAQPGIVLTPSGVPAAMAQAATDVAQMGPQFPFSPGEPVRPYDGYSRTPREFDFVTSYNVATRPRTHERVTFETLRGLIEAYDIAQICIWHRIDTLRGLKWKLIAADGYSGDVTGAIDLGMAALKKPDRRHNFKTWLGKWMYDILAYDAGALYRLRNRGGRAIGLLPVDGTMIAPLLDYWGNSPEPPAEAYVQYAVGVPWVWLTRDDLIYEPFRAVNNSPYGKAPIESILLNANTDIRFQLYFLQRFTEGNIPEAFASAPETWGPDQIEQFQGYWDALIYGDQAAKHQIKWMPGGSGITWSNERDFSDQFSMFLMRKTCASYHIVPTDLGFTETSNYSSGESQADVQHKVGELPLMEFTEEVLSQFLYDDLGLPLQFEWDRGEDQDDRLVQAQADDIYIKNATVDPDEIREMRFGLPKSARPVQRFVFTERSGPVPLSALMAVAGPTDPDTGAPDPHTPLPETAFTEVQGVLSNPALLDVPLAEHEFGPKALPPSPPMQPEGEVVPSKGAPKAPVLKDGETAGITADTGITSYDLAGRDDDDDDDDGPVQLAKAEVATYRRFAKARRRAGEWRDFTFQHADPVTAHRLNDAGRLTVRKDAGQIAVAGLAVLAADTGRVLMLQRALEAGDPAGGTWEFPGGHIEDGEDPLAAAWREWAEETGCIPPPGQQTGSWVAANGIYEGIVWTVDREVTVPVRADSLVPNPDDPDGDAVEAIAWWDPAQLPGNQAVRPELLADMDAVLAALGCSQPYEGDESVCPCGTPVVYDESNGWQHADGSISHDDGESVSDKMAEVAKAADARPKAWPGWSASRRAVGYWVPLVSAAATAALSQPRLAQLAADYQAAFPAPAEGTQTRKRDRNTAAAGWLTSQGVTFGLDDLAAGIVQDGYLIGAVSATALVTGQDPDWAGWQPGDTDTARDHAATLSSAGVVEPDAVAAAAGRMTRAYLAALARALTDGVDAAVTAKALAAALAAVLADQALGRSVVLTEITQASADGAEDVYDGHSIDLFDVLNGPDPCPLCLALAEGGPHGPGVVPVHPNCECVEVPHVS
jgi:8-oxo-dGTP pyrophosphatase MutT (NUDIX family)